MSPLGWKGLARIDPASRPAHPGDRCYTLCTGYASPVGPVPSNPGLQIIFGSV